MAYSLCHLQGPDSFFHHVDPGIELLVGLVASTLTHLSHLSGLTDVNLCVVKVDGISFFFFLQHYLVCVCMCTLVEEVRGQVFRSLFFPSTL